MVSFLDLQKINARHAGEIKQAISGVVDSGWYVRGQALEAFERHYADFIGTRYAIGTGNGLDALSIILKAYIAMGQMNPGDEVLVAANTFIASVLAIRESGLKPVYVDADPQTLMIDGRKLEEAITPRTRAVMIVHLYGQCAYTEQIHDVCRQHNLMLIEDNAQAHGCRYGNRRTGALGDAAGHSFYPGKNLGALGDGGMITTDDEQLAQTARAIANYGFSQKYYADYVGGNSRLDDLQAAVLNVKLRYLDADNQRRKEIARRYFGEIQNPLVEMPLKDCKADCVFHLFPVLCEERDRLQQHLADNGIQTLIHYPVPPHQQKCFEHDDMQNDMRLSLPVAELIASHELSLPVSPVMTDEEVAEVVSAVNSF